MRAAVVHSFGQPLVIEERRTPDPGPGQGRPRHQRRDARRRGRDAEARWRRRDRVDGRVSGAAGRRSSAGRCPRGSCWTCD